MVFEDFDFREFLGNRSQGVFPPKKAPVAGGHFGEFFSSLQEFFLGRIFLEQVGAQPGREKLARKVGEAPWRERWARKVAEESC